MKSLVLAVAACVWERVRSSASGKQGTCPERKWREDWQETCGSGIKELRDPKRAESLNVYLGATRDIGKFLSKGQQEDGA